MALDNLLDMAGQGHPGQCEHHIPDALSICICQLGGFTS